MRHYSTVVLAALFTIGLVAGVAECADEDALTTCGLTFSLDRWPGGSKAVQGQGTIACDDGQSAAVNVRVKGESPKGDHTGPLSGQGSFADVADINDLLGTYRRGDSGETSVFSRNEAVSVTLSWTSPSGESAVTVKKILIKRSK